MALKKSKIDKIDRSTENCIVIYECFLNEQCRISFQWYTSNSKLEYRDLTGPEKNRLFQAIKIPVLFPNLPKNEDIQHLWMSFYHLITQLKTNCDGDTFKEDSQNWVRLFCSVYQTKHVTPYIHAFGMHVHEFLHLMAICASFLSKDSRNSMILQFYTIFVERTTGKGTLCSKYCKKEIN